MGLMTRVPTLVKIDKFKGRQHGDDMDIVSHFINSQKDDEKEIDDLEDELLDMGYDY